MSPAELCAHSGSFRTSEQNWQGSRDQQPPGAFEHSTAPCLTLKSVARPTDRLPPQRRALAFWAQQHSKRNWQLMAMLFNRRSCSPLSVATYVRWRDLGGGTSKVQQYKCRQNLSRFVLVPTCFAVCFIVTAGEIGSKNRSSLHAIICFEVFASPTNRLGHGLD